MIFTTQLELNITIKDINAIYEQDYEAMLLKYAKELYEGKCRDGQFIRSIDRVIKRSLSNLIRRDLIAKVRVYVVVEATAIRYDQYDIITGMKVEKIISAGKIGNSDIVQCINDHVSCLMLVPTGIDNFTVGDIIPIRVGQAPYRIGDKHILINGYPFVPYIPDPMRFTVGKLSPEIKTYFEKMLASLIKREVDRKESLDKQRWDKFSKLLYPYKEPSKIKGDIDILDIDAIETHTIGIDYHIDMSNLKLIGERKSEESITVVEDPKTTLARLTFQFVKWLSVVNDFVEQYPTDEEFEHLKYIWDMYESNKH